MRRSGELGVGGRRSGFGILDVLRAIGHFIVLSCCIFKLHSHSVYSELRGDVNQRPCLAVGGVAFADGSCCVLVFCVMLATITYSF